MRKILTRLREWARDYEPATARMLVTAFIQILLLAGVTLGDFPKIADAVLTFVGMAATVVAGRSIRKAVYSPATHQEGVLGARINGYMRGVRDSAPRA